jgi:hypothetical protein
LIYPFDDSALKWASARKVMSRPCLKAIACQGEQINKRYSGWQGCPITIDLVRRIRDLSCTTASLAFAGAVA